MTRELPWNSQYPPSWPQEIEYPEITVPELLRQRTEEFADNTAFIFQDQRYSYSELQDEVDRVSAGLASVGVKKADHVSICLPNSPPAVFSFYGILSLGGVTVHTSFMYTESELQRQLTDADASVLVVLDKFADRVANVIDDTPVETVIVASLSEYASPAISEFLGRQNEDLIAEQGWQWYEQLVNSESSNTPPRPEIDVDSLASLPYTGGTTGFPKGVRLTHRNWISEAAVGELVDLVAYDDEQNIRRGEQTVTGLMPMFHVNGNWSANLFAVYNGSAAVLYSKFDPRVVLRDIESYNVTHMHTVPTMLSGLLDQPEIDQTDFDSLRHAMVASAPVPTETKAAFEELTDATIFEGYGQTEVAMSATVEPPKNRKEGSCGLPVPGLEVDIFDTEANDSLGAGDVGEIVMKGETIMDGYWQNEEATASTIRGGWLRTGDLGYRDGDWFFYHVDRKDDMIVTSGHNVYPAEVENVLYTHDMVKEASVIGISDDYRGQKVTAFVELTSEEAGTELVEDELRALCTDQLAKYKTPREYVFRTLPRTDVGKISRETLRRDVNS